MSWTVCDLDDQGHIPSRLHKAVKLKVLLGRVSIYNSKKPHFGGFNFCLKVASVSLYFDFSSHSHVYMFVRAFN